MAAPDAAGEPGPGDGRMRQQRSSGGEKFVRGLLLLPELRPSRRDTPKITGRSAGDHDRALSLTFNLELPGLFCLCRSSGVSAGRGAATA